MPRVTEFAICKPPIFTMQKGTRVTSTRRTGSQNPTGMPGTRPGMGGLGHQQGIWLGLSVSCLPPAFTFTGPIVIGNRHDQQISVMGFTNRPGQAAFRGAGPKVMLRIQTRKGKDRNELNAIPESAKDKLETQRKNLLRKK